MSITSITKDDIQIITKSILDYDNNKPIYNKLQYNKLLLNKLSLLSTNNNNNNSNLIENHPIITLKQSIYNSVSDIQITIDLLNILNNNNNNNNNNTNNTNNTNNSNNTNDHSLLLASYANNNEKLINSDLINILSSNLNAKKQVILFIIYTD
jgi:hypothetical protein